MKSLRVYLIVLLALALITVSSFAWRWHLELSGLQTVNMTKNPKDMSAIEKRVWDAEQRAKELEAELAKARLALEAAQGQGGGAANPNAPAGGRGQNAQNAQNAFGGRGQQQALQQIINRPEYQQAQAIQQKAQVDLQYAGLVRDLGLSGEQGDKVKSLILDRDTAMQDAAAAAQAAGLNPRSAEYQQFVDQALAAANDNLKSSLGDSGFAALTNYDATQAQRSVVNTFQQQLLQYGTANLLTDAQSEQLTQLLANSRGAQGQRGGAPAGAGQVIGFARAGGGAAGGAIAQAFLGATGTGGLAAAIGGGQQISANVLTQAQSILTPTQYQALQTMQQTQQAQQQMLALTTSALAQQQGQRGQQATQQTTGAQTTRAAAGAATTTARGARRGG